MSKLKNEPLRGVRLWLSVSDMETFALMANPGMGAEEISDLIQTMSTQDWLVLFKKFALTFHQIQQAYPLESYPPKANYSAFTLQAVSDSLCEEDPVEVKPNLDNLDDLDFD